MSATPASQQQFCVRWNSHLGSLGAAFPQLLAGQRFVDVTLACEGHQLHCHRLVLAACSSYFESLLSENPCKHPIIIMPHDIKLWEIQALVDFMYKGEVNVSQAGLPDLLRCAEVLQIRGLCGSDAALNLNSITNATHSKESNVPCINATTTSSTHPVIPAAATSVVSQTLSSSSSLSSSSVTATTSAPSTLSSLSTTITPGSNSAGNNNNITTVGQQKLQTTGQKNPVIGCASPGSQTGQSQPSANGGVTGNKRVLSMLHDSNSSGSGSGGGSCSIGGNKSQYGTTTLNNTITPKVEPVDVSMDDDMDEDSSYTMNDITKGEGEEPDYMEGSGKQGNEKQLPHHPTQTEQHLIENFDEQCDNKRNNCRNVKKVSNNRSPMLDHDYGEDTSNCGINGKHQVPKLPIKHEEDSCESNSSSGLGLKRRQNTTSEGRNAKRIATEESSTALTISSSSTLSPSDGSSSVSNNNNNNSHATNQNLGKIRVKSDENLYENYGKNVETNNNASNICENPLDEAVVQQLPPSLKFNKDEMTIFVKNPDGTGDHAQVDQSGPMIRTVRSLACQSSNGNTRNDLNGVHSGKNGSSSGSSPVGSPSASDITSICYDTPEIGETTTIKTEIDITDDQEQEQDASLNYENIVCSPSVHDYNNFNEDDEDEEDDDGQIQGNCYGDELTYDDIKLDEAYGAGPSTAQPLIISSQHHLSTAPANIPTIIIPTYATYTHTSPIATSPQPISNGTHITRVTNRPNVLKNAYLAIYNKSTGRYREVVGPITVGNVSNGVSPTICYQTSTQDQKIHVNNRNEQQNIAEGQNTEKKFDSSPNPSPSAVVLRNPRSNQPRSYSTEALYAALMDVKAGESIYRASQLHKVPRKTLRNWMKRWHIKSAFPMPRQLKQAAEKKRLKQMEIKMEKYKERDNF